MYYSFYFYRDRLYLLNCLFKKYRKVIYINSTYTIWNTVLILILMQKCLINLHSLYGIYSATQIRSINWILIRSYSSSSRSIRDNTSQECNVLIDRRSRVFLDCTSIPLTNPPRAVLNALPQCVLASHPSARIRP